VGSLKFASQRAAFIPTRSFEEPQKWEAHKKDREQGKRDAQYDQLPSYAQDEERCDNDERSDNSEERQILQRNLL